MAQKAKKKARKKPEPRKPAGELTTEEAAERLFGKRVVRRVKEEVDEPEPPENPSKKRKA